MQFLLKWVQWDSSWWLLPEILSQFIKVWDHPTPPYSCVLFPSFSTNVLNSLMFCGDALPPIHRSSHPPLPTAQPVRGHYPVAAWQRPAQQPQPTVGLQAAAQLHCNLLDNTRLHSGMAGCLIEAGVHLSMAMAGDRSGITGTNGQAMPSSHAMPWRRNANQHIRLPRWLEDGIHVWRREAVKENLSSGV